MTRAENNQGGTVQRRTILRIVAPVLGVALAVAVAAGAYQLGKPSSPPATLVVGGGSGGGVPVCSETPKKGADGLRSYPTACGRGERILAAYNSYLTTYLGVLKAPYGPGVTARQVLGNIYDQEAAGTLKGTNIPKGCKIPAPSTHAVSWPAACGPLLSPTNSATTAAPLKYAASQLGNVATSAGVDYAIHALSGNLDAGYTTSGTLNASGSPVIRQIVSAGGTLTTNAPNPNQPLSAWVPATTKVGAPSAFVWACWDAHLTATNAAGQHRQYAPYWAVAMGLTRTSAGWRMNGLEVLPVTSAIEKGAPCGAAY